MSQAFKAQGTVIQGDFGGGGAQTPIAEVVKIQMSGAKSDMSDVTNLASPSAHREYLPTLLDAGEVSLDMNYLANADDSQAQFQTMFEGQTLGAWSIILPSNRGTWTFNAYVTSFDPDLPHDKHATAAAKLKITGPRTFNP